MTSPASHNKTHEVCSLTAVGQITRSQCEDCVRQIVSHAHEDGYRKFLLDLRTSVYEGSIVAQYELINDKAGTLGLERTWKIALLVASSDESHAFQEVAAQNAGYNVRQFTSRQTALDWLLH